MTKKVSKAMVPGTHGSTFGGNPLAMSVGNAVMNEIFRKGFLSKVKSNSKYFISELNKIKNKFPNIIKEIRGIGLILGIQLHQDQTIFIQSLMKNKLLTIRAAENVIRILPPLNVNKNEINIALKIINKVCEGYKK
jgi:acetylornithine/N-succinyldiaminopimelate aminotransferase